ncbi:MAG: hypothetical protein HN608_15500, partial [Rhodospirillaceae bacterium]|nr:hypothetical protein [Rhodospirillaceae bacterium]
MAKADKPTPQPLNLPSDAPVDGFSESGTDFRPGAVPGSDTDPGIGSGIDTGIDRGRGAIQKALETMPGAPGVYRMLAHDGEVLYVGKA